MTKKSFFLCCYLLLWVTIGPLKKSIHSILQYSEFLRRGAHVRTHNEQKNQVYILNSILQCHKRNKYHILGIFLGFDTPNKMHNSRHEKNPHMIGGSSVSHIFMFRHKRNKYHTLGIFLVLYPKKFVY